MTLNRARRSIVVLWAAALLSGCAGTNFKKPEPSSLTLGRSTASDVVAVMGTPRQTSEGLKNEQKIRSLHYSYATTVGSPKYPGVVPARAMIFTTYENVLVAQEFLSSFAEDTTDFDTSRVQEIKKGTTTRADVIQLMGKPSGEAIFPVTKNKGDSALLYGYTHAKGALGSMKFYRQTLVVSFGPDGVATDVDYAVSGEK